MNFRAIISSVSPWSRVENLKKEKRLFHFAIQIYRFNIINTCFNLNNKRILSQELPKQKNKFHCDETNFSVIQENLTNFNEINLQSNL